MFCVEYQSEYGDDWPLTDNEISILDTNQESLVDLLDCSDLLIRLFSAQVINGRQRETIFSEPTNYRRNEILLDIIRRRSIDDYRRMVQCLHESNQSHVAEILDKGGGRFTGSAINLHVYTIRTSERPRICARTRMYVCMHACV